MPWQIECLHSKVHRTLQWHMFQGLRQQLVDFREICLSFWSRSNDDSDFALRGGAGCKFCSQRPEIAASDLFIDLCQLAGDCCGPCAQDVDHIRETVAKPGARLKQNNRRGNIAEALKRAAALAWLRRQQACKEK